MKSLTSSCDTEEAWRSAWTLICNHGYMTVKSHLPGVREMGNGPFWEMETSFRGSWGNAGFYPTSKNPPIVQAKLISRYLDCLLEFGKLEFPLDLTFLNYLLFFCHCLSTSTNRGPSLFVYQTVFTTNSGKGRFRQVWRSHL